MNSQDLHDARGTLLMAVLGVVLFCGIAVVFGYIGYAIFGGHPL